VSQFFRGLLTGNFVSKVVSLLLATVLFVFVQQSISDTQTIEELTIRFELAPSEQAGWVLNNDTVVLKNLRVSGLRKDLAVEIGSLRRDEFIVTKIVTRRFREKYRGEREVPIRIDAELLRAENIPWEIGEDFQLELKRAGILSIERKRDVTFRPTLSPELKEYLALDEASQFRATDGGLQVQIEWVQPNGEPITTISIGGPTSLLPPKIEASDEALPLYIKIGKLSETLRGRTLLQARAPIRIAQIDWAASGISAPNRLSVRAPIAESTASLSEQTLNFRCGLRLRPIKLSVTLPLTFSIPAPIEGALTMEAIARDFDCSGRIVGLLDVPRTEPITTWTRVASLDLLVTEAWQGKQTRLAELFTLEIDIAGATPPKDGRLEIPFRLRPRTAEGERILEDGEVRRLTEAEALLIFQKKQG